MAPPQPGNGRGARRERPEECFPDSSRHKSSDSRVLAQVELATSRHREFLPVGVLALVRILNSGNANTGLLVFGPERRWL